MRRVRRGSFIEKVRLACAPKHPYNTKTHLALQEFCFPLNGLEGGPQPRPLPHLHALLTWLPYILQVPFPLNTTNTTNFNPCEGDSGEVRPSTQVQKFCRPKNDAFMAEEKQKSMRKMGQESMEDQTWVVPLSASSELSELDMVMVTQSCWLTAEVNT